MSDKGYGESAVATYDGKERRKMKCLTKGMENLLWRPYDGKERGKMKCLTKGMENLLWRPMMERREGR